MLNLRRERQARTCASKLGVQMPKMLGLWLGSSRDNRADQVTISTVADRPWKPLSPLPWLPLLAWPIQPDSLTVINLANPER